MTDARSADLLYGHLGESTYNAESHAWHFQRSPKIKRRIQLVGKPVIAVESSTKQIRSATESSKGITQLFRLYPELCPSNIILPNIAQISGHISNVTSSHDPIKSDLLAFGNAFNSLNPRTGQTTRPIAALVAGTAGELVRLQLLSKKYLGWDGNKNAGFHTWTALGGEEGWWRGNGGSVQQLVFAETENGTSSWLAVRYHGCISILSPVLRQSPVAPDDNCRGNFLLPSSRVDANHIVTVRATHNTNQPFADVSFNPWNLRQIIAADQSGAWIVWDLKMKNKQKVLWTASRRYGGHTFGRHDQDSKECADGWAKCLWVGNLNTTLTATRRGLALFNIKDLPERLSVPDLSLNRSTDWILDVRPSPTNRNMVFVVTSSRIIWLHISTSEDTRVGKEAKSGAAVHLSWIHYRDPKDISLQLSVPRSPIDTVSVKEESTSLVVLFSRFSGLSTVFYFENSPSSNQLASFSDPSMLELPRIDGPPTMPTYSYSRGDAYQSISNLIIQPLARGSLHGHSFSQLTPGLRDDCIEFSQVCVLYNDMSLSESIFASTAFEEQMHVPVPDVILIPDRLKTPGHIRDDFVMSDGLTLEEALMTGSETASETDTNFSVQAPPKWDSLDNRTISCEWLQRHIQNPITKRPKQKIDDVLPAKNLEESLLPLLDSVKEGSLNDNPGINSLLELCDADFVVRDVDNASRALTELIESANASVVNSPIPLERENDGNSLRSRLAVPPLLTPALRDLIDVGDDISLSHVYDSLIRAFIFPLSPNVPARTRVAIDRVIRNTAALICLASYGVQLVYDLPLEGELDVSRSSEPNSLSILPVRRQVPASSSVGKGKEQRPISTPFASLRDSGLASSPSYPALPTPEPTPSLRSHTSASSIVSEDPSYLRLRRLASIDSQLSLPTKMQRLLSHWTLGANPSDYDWIATQQNIDTDGEEVTEARLEMEYRVGKRQKRHRVENSNLTLGGSQPQPLLDNIPQGVSRITQEAQGIMSQPQPGPFGTRQPKPGRVKKKAGFK